MSGMVNFYRVTTLRSDLDILFIERIIIITLVGSIMRSFLHRCCNRSTETPRSHRAKVNNVMRPDEVVIFNDPAA